MRPSDRLPEEAQGDQEPLADLVDQEDLQVLAARLYYLDGLTQTHVAQLLSVSQAKVSRLLFLARENGIVQIQVPAYDSRDEALETALRRNLHLHDAVVVRRLGQQSFNDLRKFVGYMAAPFVSSWLTDNATVAVAGGRTMRFLAEHLQPEGSGGNTIIQCMGNINATPGMYDALEFGRVMAKKLKGRLVPIEVCVLAPDPKTCRQATSSPSVREALSQMESAEFAMVGVGNLRNSVFLEQRILTLADLEQLERAGAVGEIAGRFYDADGNECDTTFRDRAVSIPLDQLRHMKHVAGVVLGCDRAEAILGAVRGGILNYLVTDDLTAKALLGLASSANAIEHGAGT